MLNFPSHLMLINSIGPKLKNQLFLKLLHRVYFNVNVELIKYLLVTITKILIL